jgi:hypothetical protein
VFTDKNLQLKQNFMSSVIKCNLASIYVFMSMHVTVGSIAAKKKKSGTNASFQAEDRLVEHMLC